MEETEKQLLYLFSTSLHGRLKCYVKGHVYCRITDDDLFVSIEHKDVTFSYIRPEIMDAIHCGVDVQDITDEVIREYRKILNKVFFMDNGGKNNGISKHA